jgi:hypothetical protein
MMGSISASYYHHDIDPDIIIPRQRSPRFLVACRIYFQEVGDDLSGQGQYAYYRWASTTTYYRSWPMTVIPLKPQFWSHVTGERGDASAAATAGFEQALAYPRSIGIWCSGGYVARDRDHPRALVDPTFSMFSFAVCDTQPSKRMRRARHRTNKLSLSRSLARSSRKRI